MTISRNNVVIAGGGPAGLLTGIRLLKAGFEVEIFEKENLIGHPQHCSGIVSSNFIEDVGLPHKLIVNKLYGVEIVSGEYEYTVSASTPKAYVIDRFEYEIWLSEKFKELGGKLNLGSPIKNLNVLLKEDAIVVDARGAISLINRVNEGVLPAFQMISTLNSELNRKLAYIHIDKNINKDFFSWLVNIGNGNWKIGTASLSNLRAILERVLSLMNLKEMKVRKYLYGFVLVKGPVEKFRSGDILLIGDAAGQTKPTTGGGLYYHAIASRLLTKSLYEGVYDYTDEFKKLFWKEIMLQRIVRELFLKLSQKDIEELLKTFSKKEVFNLLLTYGDMDLHVTSLIRTLEGLKYLKDFVKIVGVRKLLDSIL